MGRCGGIVIVQKGHNGQADHLHIHNGGGEGSLIHLYRFTLICTVAYSQQSGRLYILPPSSTLGVVGQSNAINPQFLR